jgi:aminopeptidase N
VGEPEFFAGLRSYFAEHAYGNTELEDLLHHLESASGRELGSWSKEWLQTSGVNTLTPVFEVDADGAFTSFTVHQAAHPDYPTLRRHRIAIGLYDRKNGELVRSHRVEVDVAGDETPIDPLVGMPRPDLVLLNDDDLTYAKIRLDEQSLATLLTGIDSFIESLPRALCWGSAWDMTRDAEMRASDFVALVLQGVGTESDLTAVGSLLRQAQLALSAYSAPSHREELRQRWEQGLRRLVEDAQAGSDHQLAFVRAYATAVRSVEGVDHLQGLLDGTTTLPEQAAAARAGQGTPEAKEQAWHLAVERTDVPNETQRSIAAAFQVADQADVLRPYVARYLEAAGTVWETLGTQRATNVLVAMFPRVLVDAETLSAVDDWLASTDANPAAKRLVGEGRADIQRGLAAQAFDARE